MILNIDKEESTIFGMELIINTNINNESFIVSDADEELLILISFKEIIDLKSVKIDVLTPNNNDNEMSAPKEIDIYKINNLNINFDDLTWMKSDKSINCILKKIRKRTEY